MTVNEPLSFMPLDLDTLPPFCTDSQAGCIPFRSTDKESEGMRGH